MAAGLLAESATGIVFGMNVPDSCIPLLKSTTIHFQRRMQGNLTAIAKISEEQINILLTNEKGSFEVEVTISDESEQRPIVCAMEWAWVSKDRTKK